MTTTTIPTQLQGDTSLRTAVELLTQLTPLQLANVIEDINYYNSEDADDDGPTHAFKKAACYQGASELTDDNVYRWVYQLQFLAANDVMEEFASEGQITVSEETKTLISQLESLYSTKVKQGKLLQVVETLNKMTDKDREFVLSQLN